MIQEELEKLLEGDELIRTLDVKTLVLDIVREMSEEEILEIFWRKLPGLQSDYVRGYLYMKRP